MRSLHRRVSSFMAGEMQPLSVELPETNGNGKSLASVSSNRRCGSLESVVCLLTFMAVAALLIMLLDYQRLEGLVSFFSTLDQPDFFRRSPAELLFVARTVVHGAVEKGAVCLDGSPPSYHLHRGKGFGKNNWLIHLEGGGWCQSKASCMNRSTTSLGSSSFMEENVVFGGILSDSPLKNPDFYDWNRVKVRYCDGGSFSGERESPLEISDDGSNQMKKIYFRGQRIWHAVMEDLLSKGLMKAEKAFLSGCSAGGLASILHCDDFRSRFPEHATVKCLSDAGIFLDIKDVRKNPTIEYFYKDVVSMHGIDKSLPVSCKSEIGAAKCFFPQYLLQSIKAPLFILNPAYDTWQIDHILAPAPPNQGDEWRFCKQNPATCSFDQQKVLQGFRVNLLEAIGPVGGSENGGLFINSCFIHCQSEWDVTWHGKRAPRVKGRTAAETVGDWFFKRQPAKDIDCPYPCNPSCFKVGVWGTPPGN